RHTRFSRDWSSDVCSSDLRILVLGQQVVKRLVAVRAQILGNRLVPFLAIGEYGIDIEYHAAEVEQAVAHNVADAKARFAMARSLDPAARLGGIELCAVHGPRYSRSALPHKARLCKVILNWVFAICVVAIGLGMARGFG